MKRLYFLLLLCGLVGVSARGQAEWGYDLSKPLLNVASQLSTNACAKNCDSSEGHLIDGDEETYFHSSWSTASGSKLPNEKHYLQWHLTAAQQHLFFTYVGMNWPSAHNSPQDVTILATNTPKDAGSWVEVAHLQDMIKTPEVYPAYYTSPHLDCGAAYTDFRMVVNGTTTGSKEGTYGQYFFCLSEFQVYEAIEGFDMSQNVPEGADRAINLVFIGNSITYGATLSSPATEAPPVHVASQLAAATGRPVLMTNCGVSGSTTVDWQPGSSFYNKAYAAAGQYTKQGGQVVFSMMLGTNDSAEKGPTGSPVAPADYKANVKKIIDALMAAYPDAKFLLNYPIWYSPNTHNGATYLQAGLDRLQSYHPIITDIVAEYQAAGKAVVAGDRGAYTFFEGNKRYFTSENGYSGTFYLHPNATGAVKLAEFWTKSIFQMIDTDGSIAKRRSDEALLDSAMVLAAAQFSTTSVTTDKLLQNGGEEGCQLSCNASEGGEGTLEQLMDNSTATAFQSNKTSAMLYSQHLLDIDLRRDTISKFRIRMSRRTDKAANTNNMMPNDVSLYVRQDTTEAWRFLCRLNKGFPGRTSTAAYLSPLIYTGQPCRYLRLVVNSNMANAMTKCGVPYFNMGEIQIFPGRVNEAKSDYCSMTGMAAACDALTACCATLSARLAENGALTDDEVTTLKAAIQRIYDVKDEATAIHAATAGADAPAVIYTLQGVRLNVPAKDLPKGVYIINGRKVVF